MQQDESKRFQTGRTLPITFVVTFLGFLDTNLLIPIMALYASELGASLSVTGLIIGLYSITNTPANILFGRLIDRVSYKLPLIAGLLGDALSMFLYSLCRLPIHLALVRMFHGTSGGLVSPATMYIFAGSSRTARGKAMSFYGMSLGVATLVGFGLSGILVSRLGYRDFFLFGMAILIVGAAVGLLLPGAEKKGNMAVKTSSGEGFKKVKDLFRRKGLTVSYCSIFAQYFSFGGLVTLLPLYVRNLGMGTFHMGMLLAIFAILFVIAQFPSGALSDRIGRLIPTTIGLSIGIVSLLVLPTLGTFPTLAAVMALYGIAYGVLFPSISALVVDNTAPEERGTATGIFHALLTAGVATGAPIIGWVGGIVGVELGLTLSAVIMFLALAIALKALRRS